jgi:hypothetical protein
VSCWSPSRAHTSDSIFVGFQALPCLIPGSQSVPKQGGVLRHEHHRTSRVHPILSRMKHAHEEEEFDMSVHQSTTGDSTRECSSISIQNPLALMSCPWKDRPYFPTPIAPSIVTGEWFVSGRSSTLAPTVHFRYDSSRLLEMEESVGHPYREDESRLSTVLQGQPAQSSSCPDRPTIHRPYCAGK